MAEQPLPALPSNLTLGYVHLAVSNLDRSTAYYQHSLGFQLHRRENDMAYLGAGEADLLVLTEQPDAQPAGRSTGLYHFAILVPSRLELAHVVHRLSETQTTVSGFADHAVSEAIYLSDPDDNGIEIYRDRPRSDWYDKNGRFLLTTLPLDLDGVLAERERQPEVTWQGLAKGTVLGHMHLKVGTLAEANYFYCEVLGFDLMARAPGALFISAGGYHHHLGLNIWESAGAPPAPPDAVGLLGFTIVLPDQAALDKVKTRILANGIDVEEHSSGIAVRDSFQNKVIFVTAT